MLPPGTDLSFVNQLPPLAQGIILALFFLATAAVAWRGYFAPPPKPVPTSPDVVLTGGAIADMEPVRELAKSVARQADAAEKTAAAAIRDAVAAERRADALEGILALMRSELSDRKERAEEDLRDENRRLKQAMANIKEPYRG